MCILSRRRKWQKSEVGAVPRHPPRHRRLRAPGADRDRLGDGGDGGEARADRGAAPGTDPGVVVGTKGTPGGDIGGGATAEAGRTFSAVKACHIFLGISLYAL